MPLLDWSQSKQEVLPSAGLAVALSGLVCPFRPLGDTIRLAEGYLEDMLWRQPLLHRRSTMPFGDRFAELRATFSPSDAGVVGQMLNGDYQYCERPQSKP